MTIERLLEDFAVLEAWEDRYLHIIELGSKIPALPEEYKIPANKVQGCVSQVWLILEPYTDENGQQMLRIRGDSDALITRGLLALIIEIASDNTPRDIANLDIDSFFKSIKLDEHLSPQRSNGVASVIAKIRMGALAMTSI